MTQLLDKVNRARREAIVRLFLQSHGKSPMRDVVSGTIYGGASQHNNWRHGQKDLICRYISRSSLEV